MTAIENSQAEIKTEVSSLTQDTSDIKSMMIEIYQAFKGQSTPSSSSGYLLLHFCHFLLDLDSASGLFELTQSTRHVSSETCFAGVRWYISPGTTCISPDLADVTHVATEEPPSHIKGETKDMETENKEEKPKEPKMAVPHESSQAPKRVDKGKRILTDDVESQVKLVPASRVVRGDPNEPVRIKKAVEQARLLAITKPEVVKVVHEEAENIGIDPERIKSSKEGEKFKKAQDVKLKVLNKERSEKLRKSLTLRKHKFKSYMWTIGNRLKHEKIVDVKIHPHTKPVVVTVYRGTNRRNFEVHNPFAFGAFGITELDELGEINLKKKNIVVKDLMNSLSRRYERIKKIPKDLSIQSALPALIPEQAPSQILGRKRKHMELEPEVKVPGLDCDRSLPKGVPFVNNMVIEEPKYEIFFIDVFGDKAFQIWNDIHKVGVDSLVSYLVIASMIKTQENSRFSLKLRKLIAEDPDQEKLK
ncbi:hypothetical protein Tco_0001659 [Tanacetum coccineum]